MKMKYSKDGSLRVRRKFSADVRRAISGMSLEEAQRLLRRHGIKVTKACISHWQTTKRMPEWPAIAYVCRALDLDVQDYL